MKMCRAEYGGRYDDILGKDDAVLVSPGALHTTRNKITRHGVSLSVVVERPPNSIRTINVFVPAICGQVQTILTTAKR
jgi:hypothetical protein